MYVRIYSVCVHVCSDYSVVQGQVDSRVSPVQLDVVKVIVKVYQLLKNSPPYHTSDIFQSLLPSGQGSIRDSMEHSHQLLKINYSSFCQAFLDT